MSELISENIRKPNRMPWVVPIYCDGCASCVNRCRSGNLIMTETNVEGVYVPWLAEPEKCSGCANCTDACAMGAITMTSYVNEAILRFKEKKPVINT